MKINPGNARGLLVPQGDRPFSFVVYSSEIRDFGFSYELFLGPYSTKMEASKELLRLEKEGAASLQMFFKNNKEVFIKVREFSDMEEAENWSRFFVNKYHLNKVRLSRASNKDRNLVQLIFPEVDLKRAQTLLNLANKKRIPIYHCQLK